MTLRARRAADEEGLIATELAVVFVALLFFLLLIVQYGLWFHAKQAAVAAASEATDAAQVQGATAADGEAAARDLLGQVGNLRDVEVRVTRGPETVVVEVRGEAPRLVPGLAVPVTARAQAAVERFVPEGDR